MTSDELRQWYDGLNAGRGRSCHVLFEALFVPDLQGTISIYILNWSNTLFNLSVVTRQVRNFEFSNFVIWSTFYHVWVGITNKPKQGISLYELYPNFD